MISGTTLFTVKVVAALAGLFAVERSVNLVYQNPKVIHYVTWKEPQPSTDPEKLIAIQGQPEYGLVGATPSENLRCQSSWTSFYRRLFRQYSDQGEWLTGVDSECGPNQSPRETAVSLYQDGRLSLLECLANTLQGAIASWKGVLRPADSQASDPKPLTSSAILLLLILIWTSMLPYFLLKKMAARQQHLTDDCHHDMSEEAFQDIQKDTPESSIDIPSNRTSFSESGTRDGDDEGDGSEPYSAILNISPMSLT